MYLILKLFSRLHTPNDNGNCVTNLNGIDNEYNN